MNDNFKKEFVAFMRDLKAICDAAPDCGENCPLRSDGWCINPSFPANVDDLNKAIAAVEAYRKHKKPCVEVIDRADDIVQLEVTVHRYKPNSMRDDVSHTARISKTGIDYIFGRVPVDVKIISAKRFVLESHKPMKEEE